MPISIYIILGLIFLVIALSFLWRYSSRRKSLPCPSWLSWMVELDNPFTKTNRAHVIIEYLQLEPGMSVLDAGCGPGRLTIPIAIKLANNGTVTAMDIQVDMLRKVKEKANLKNLKNINYINAGLGYGKLEANKYDRVLLVTVLGEIPDQHAALSEIFYALKQGGILSITEVIFDPHFQTRGHVRKLAAESGFKEKDIFGSRIAFTMHLEKPNLC